MESSSSERIPGKSGSRFWGAPPCSYKPGEPNVSQNPQSNPHTHKTYGLKRILISYLTSAASGRHTWPASQRASQVRRASCQMCRRGTYPTGAGSSGEVDKDQRCGSWARTRQTRDDRDTVRHNQGRPTGYGGTISSQAKVIAQEGDTHHRLR